MVKDLDSEYQSYLERWKKRFADSRDGEVSYNYRETKVYVPVFRLTRGEFAVAFAELGKSQQRYEEAEKEDDISGMRKALKEGFPYELMLLMK